MCPAGPDANRSADAGAPAGIATTQRDDAVERRAVVGHRDRRPEEPLHRLRSGSFGDVREYG